MPLPRGASLYEEPSTLQTQLYDNSKAALYSEIDAVATAGDGGAQIQLESESCEVGGLDGQYEEWDLGSPGGTFANPVRIPLANPYGDTPVKNGSARDADAQTHPTLESASSDDGDLNGRYEDWDLGGKAGVQDAYESSSDDDPLPPDPEHASTDYMYSAAARSIIVGSSRDEDAVIMSGWFQKRGEQKFSKSQVRWFEMTSSGIRYYAKKDSNGVGDVHTYKGTIGLQPLTKAASKNKAGNRHQLRIEQPCRTYRLIPYTDATGACTQMTRREGKKQVSLWRDTINALIKGKYE